jgi:hypothetical protein
MGTLDGVGLTFEESMSGYLGIGEAEPRLGAERGRRESTPIRFDVRIRIDDLARFISRVSPVQGGSAMSDIRWVSRGRAASHRRTRVLCACRTGIPSSRRAVLELFHIRSLQDAHQDVVFVAARIATQEGTKWTCR